MFYEKDTFESIDLRGFTLGNLQTVQNMFSASTCLKEVYLDGLVNAGVTKMLGMFRDCSSLEYISMNGCDT